jgi:hypothetical protein
MPNALIMHLLFIYFIALFILLKIYIEIYNYKQQQQQPQLYNQYGT